MTPYPAAKFCLSLLTILIVLAIAGEISMWLLRLFTSLTKHAMAISYVGLIGVAVVVFVVVGVIWFFASKD